MGIRNVIWLPRVKRKLIRFRSARFSPEETLDHISQTILEVEALLSNPVLGRSYIEEMGHYKGVTRVVVNKFRIYYEQVNGEITIVAVLFPGEHKSNIKF